MQIKIHTSTTGKEGISKYIVYIHPGISLGEIVISLSKKLCFITYSMNTPFDPIMLRTIANELDSLQKEIDKK